MPLSRALLLISAVAGAVSVLGAYYSDGQLAAQGGLAVVVSLGAYVVVAGRAAAPGTRWALAAGLAGLAVGMALRLHWYAEPATGFQWLTPFYAPLDGGAAQVGRPDANVLDLWRQAIDHQRVVAFLHLFAVVSFAVAVFTLPGSPRPKRAALTGALAVLVVVVAADNVRRQVDGVPAVDALGAAWPALLAAFICAGMVALAGWRADRAWLVAVGTLLVALAVADAAEDLTGRWSAWWTFSQIAGNDTVSVAFSVSLAGAPEVDEALTATAELAGPALLTVGALHAARRPALGGWE